MNGDDALFRIAEASVASKASHDRVAGMVRIARAAMAAVMMAGMATGLSAAGPSAAAPVWAQFSPNPPHVAVWDADQIDSSLVATPAGCYDAGSVQGLDRMLRGGIGPVKGFDSPRIVPMPDGRTLWLLQDAFLDYHGGATMREIRMMTEIRYTNSAVLIQDQQGCFTAVAHGDRTNASSFEPGTNPKDPWHQYWWPAGASAAAGTLQIVWVEMTHDSTEDRPPMAGPAIHPVATWLGIYDIDTLQRLSFELAPNTGVFPIVAFDAVDDPATGWTYLFGNSFLQNLPLEPNPPLGAHSATVTTLARVPLGRLDGAPQFWDGEGWVADERAAVPIAQAGTIEHIMHPQLIKGVWWSTTKPNGFLGNTVIVETAPAPQGPWTLWGSVPATAHGPRDEIWAGSLTYAPVLAPWLDAATGHPIVVLSQIDPGWWDHDGGDPARYRPQAIAVPHARDLPAQVLTKVDRGPSAARARTGRAADNLHGGSRERRMSGGSKS